ncbi:tail protein X [Pectobacterium aroidearum]|uniref:Tail protein X n=1 Tax=Pectobacterium aroidearum TaxID=1201031 RepID=A0ABR5ZFP4_9GAMM|nr:MULTISPECIES: tail protein X [Pectobacterium]KHS86753.1 membrane protein [Pectobacterium brasiliense]MBA5200550.1 tail protein X [Pectobacterium aroidearum]MBA5233342.1 tail protein X [Pectobacterium aroidearum]
MRYIEHVTKMGDRWDLLSQHYYGDPLGYDRIIMANPHVAVTPSLPSGTVLLIPMIEQDEVENAEEVAPWLR